MWPLKKSGGPEAAITPEKAFVIVFVAYLLWTIFIPVFR
jgi:hypothetical protein